MEVKLELRYFIYLIRESQHWYLPTKHQNSQKSKQMVKLVPNIALFLPKPCTVTAGNQNNIVIFLSYPFLPTKVLQFLNICTGFLDF